MPSRLPMGAPPRTEPARTRLGWLATRAVGAEGARDPQHAVLEE